MTTMPTVDPFQFDYRRHVAAQDLMPQHQEDFQRLVKLLRYATRFQLLFARIVDESYRGLLIRKLQDLLNAADRPVHTVDLADEQRFPDFAALEAWLETAGQGQAVIHLVNTGHWLQVPRVGALNVRRNALAEKVDATLLWWMPPEVLARVAQQAPDAWSWRGGVFDFIADVPVPADALHIPLDAAADIGPLTLAQRSRRLAVLNQQLSVGNSVDIPDVFRLNLLLEQAQLYQSLGQLDLANQALRQDALPLAERLGDARAKAMVLTGIASNLAACHELDAVLVILEEGVLPIFERLDNARDKAVAWGKMADIQQMRGEWDEALRIRAEEELPVYERLADFRERALTQAKIAEIFASRGQFIDALRILGEEALPTFERFGDVRRKAVTLSMIADVLGMRGELDEALRVLKGQVLPVFERLGDIRAKAATQGRIAQIYELRKEFDEALALYEQTLAIAQQLNDVDVVAATRVGIARTRLRRGDQERGGLPEITENLADAFAIEAKLGQPLAIGLTGEWLAQVQAMGGQRDEALRVLDQAESAYAKLGRDDALVRMHSLRKAIAGGSDSVDSRPEVTSIAPATISEPNKSGGAPDPSQS